MQNWASFEPQKTTVKRMPQQERLRVNADNPFRKTKKEFDSQMEALAIIQQKSNGSPVSSSSMSSTGKFQSHAYAQGNLLNYVIS